MMTTETMPACEYCGKPVKVQSARICDPCWETTRLLDRLPEVAVTDKGKALVRDACLDTLRDIGMDVRSVINESNQALCNVDGRSLLEKAENAAQRIRDLSRLLWRVRDDITEARCVFNEGGDGWGETLNAAIKRIGEVTNDR